MAVPVVIIDLWGGEFWVYNQYTFCSTGADHLIGSLQCKGCGRAGHQHIKTKPGYTQFVLNFDSDGWIITFCIGAADDHGINLRGRLVCFFKGDSGSIQCYLCLVRKLTFFPFGDLRPHTVNIKDAVLYVGVTGFDA